MCRPVMEIWNGQTSYVLVTISTTDICVEDTQMKGIIGNKKISTVLLSSSGSIIY
ncbi:hypothetical protein CY34DRAFT_803229 [Suillus luteus UH-Slu-Lm8-n1]|uniref:Uncharacterized protein n=1 Tax=Suillus luteus UH-Slu-Lm8-n1 TaxID=930992 RepID=A0A0D0BL82_9AGAM|nr:hypothetical protein CY34DRAFT_803229 [Suillus luteus UH-Slu-Lm8-n1]